ncbi:MAG: 1-acyl-sn-glycerol-3-phosphate acyltransferase [Acidimicrobiales bacterium]|nr:1-acyl-sn-glycerol-3-phosphate acyltransferase [Acidimicrobiales bacterium]
MATLSKNTDLNKTKAVKHLWKTGRRAASLPRQAAVKTQFPLRSAPTPHGVDPLPSKVGANYDTEWARRPGARLTRRVFLNTVWEPVITYYAEPTVRNADRLKALGGSGAIFASNHHSHADTIVMMTALPKPWRNRLFIGGAADYFFTSRPTSVLSALFIGAVPISRTGISRRTIEQPIKLLKKDWSMVIYPEGGRSQDGWAQDFKAGVAFLSKQSGAPVVPVHIDGTGSVMPKGQNWPTRAKVSVNFGQPMHMLEGETNQQFTDRIEAAIALLADENETDWWTARLRQAQGQTPSLQGPEVSPWRRKWATKSRRRVHAPSMRRKRWPFV